MYFTPTSQQFQITHPAYYQQKANQLRQQNQILKRQLQAQKNHSPSFYQKYSPEIQNTSTINVLEPRFGQQFQKQIPQQRTVIYRRIGQPINSHQFRTLSPQKYERYNKLYLNSRRIESQNVFPDRYRQYEADIRARQHQKHLDEIEEYILQLQNRGYKLQREANKLSSYIKEDLRDFVIDSYIHKECNYKKKYLKAISNRPRYFHFTM